MTTHQINGYKSSEYHDKVPLAIVLSNPKSSITSMETGSWIWEDDEED